MQHALRTNTIKDAEICVLWDASHIWGLLVRHALESLKLPFYTVQGENIAQALFSGKRPALLLVPGGSAKHKAHGIGSHGRKAIQRYIAEGGNYLGICGGAGLALSPGTQQKKSANDYLQLCPWQRAPFADRMQHFMSGHFFTTASPHSLTPEHITTLPDSPQLPVWWPGRFAPQESPEQPVQVLATYTKAAADFWLADLAIGKLPSDIFSIWENIYGITIKPTFLEQQACIITGAYQQGSYVLSYAHLETPDSPDANHWFSHLLNNLGHADIPPHTAPIPDWRLDTLTPCWNDPILQKSYTKLQGIIALGYEQGLFFPRTNWLFGWRTGLPGAALNNLRATLHTIISTPATGPAEKFWTAHKAEFAACFSQFEKKVTHYLLAERLAQTLSKALPNVVPPENLAKQRNVLFGPPMQEGGLYKQLITPLDALCFIQDPHSYSPDT